MEYMEKKKMGNKLRHFCKYGGIVMGLIGLILDLFNIIDESVFMRFMVISIFVIVTNNQTEETR